MEALSAITTRIIFNKMFSKCLFQNLLQEVTDNAETVNPHIIVETIAWNALMVAIIAAKIA